MRSKTDKRNQHRKRLIDLGMLFKALTDLFYKRGKFLSIVVAHPYFPFDMTMGDPRTIDNGCIGKNGVGQIDRSFLFVANRCRIPPDLFDMPFNAKSSKENVVPFHKGTGNRKHYAAAKIRNHILTRKAHSCSSH